MNDEHIIRRSAGSKVKGKTDWERVKNLTDEEIERAAREDPDWEGLLDIDWSKAVLVVPAPKKAVSIRLDADVLDFFKQEGRGYQTRINQVLRSYMEHRKNEAEDA
ncbi:hypothetical protein CH339_00870 [Rhodobium orientis]|uniref:3-oxoacyl-ACP synthase n=1 Tax=Rhodobium orientis TaxID=34017 RepID=A0A327JX02_9HYPH|nr:BrnA antitoxin family protein [Rhodobium orientis]MBK5949773.1 hypothetical protein [Rhodobium orientis]RAI30116.1 hypothetical protein CH339_00870 [Rhodobium orientis]